MKSKDRTNPLPYKIENDNQGLWLTDLEVFYEFSNNMVHTLPYRNI